MAEHCITNSYRKWNFTDRERKKLKDLDKEVLKSRKKQDKLIKQINVLDEKLSSHRRDENKCWNKAGKMLGRLERRCKHQGDRYVTEKYRDFGTDVIRQHCSMCGKILEERGKDN